MADNVGNDSSELESISSSQASYLKNCPFAGHEASPTKSTDSDNTEVLGNQISPAVVETPALSSSSPTSLGSVNGDVFRTPPENASLSSAADSEPRVRVSEIKLRGGSSLTSPSSTAETTPVSVSPSENIRVVETKGPSDFVPLSPPPSVAADGVRVPAKHPDSDSASPTVTGSTTGLKTPIFASVANDGALKSPERVPNLGSVSATKRNKVSETENSEEPLPFKEIIEALLRNSGQKPKERDENVSCVDILKRCGFKFP